jgi:ABC-type nitrate/sulfonate/bicarbonate transport system permease component
MMELDSADTTHAARRISPIPRIRSQPVRIASIIGFFLIWEAVTLIGIFSPILLPSPIEVLDAAREMLVTGILLPNIAASLKRVFAGFMLAVLIAVPLGIMCGWYRTLLDICDPIIELFRPIPVLALLPLAILWFGIGESSKIFLITYGAFFPIFINTLAGVRFVDPIYVEAAESLGATRLQIFYRVILMAALPNIFTGLRLGIGFAFLTIVAAEMIASQRGLGYLIVDTQLTFQTDRTLVATLMFGILGFLMSTLLLQLERRMLRWNKGLQQRKDK